MNHFATILAFAAAVAGLAGAAQAKDQAVTSEAVARSAVQAPAMPAPAENISIAVLDGRNTLWTGSLRIGGPYGNASFSQSRSEYAEPCPGETRPEGSYSSSSQNLSFNIQRHNGLQQTDRFNFSLNWSRPLTVCQGEGNDNFGFNRVVTLAPGESVTVAGSGTMTVRLTRGR